MKLSNRYTAFYARARKAFFMEFVEAILAAIVVAVLLRVFVVSVYRVPTESMMPTLWPGDFIVALKTSYGVQIPFSNGRIGRRSPSRGDIVVFQAPDDEAMFVKRVVGVEGDRVEIRDGRLSVNDVATATLKETIGEWEIFEETSGRSTHRVMRRRNVDQADFLAAQIVPPGHVFLMGDLRSDSFDSRQWGPISIDQVIARAAFVGMSVQIRGRSDASGAFEALGSGFVRSATGSVRFDRVLKTIE